MTSLNSLQNSSRPARSRKRVGRGIGSGVGKTCGRGEKGLEETVLVVMGNHAETLGQPPIKPSRELAFVEVRLHEFDELASELRLLVTALPLRGRELVFCEIADALEH